MASETENVAGIVKRLDDRAHNLHITAFNNATEDSLRVTLHDFLLFTGDCAHNIAAAHEREVSELRRRLDVAEGALDKFVKSESTNHEWYKCYAKEALGSIR